MDKLVILAETGSDITKEVAEAGNAAKNQRLCAGGFYKDIREDTREISGNPDFVSCLFCGYHLLLSERPNCN